MPSPRQFDASSVAVIHYSPIAEMTSKLTEELTKLIGKAAPGTRFNFFVIQKPVSGQEMYGDWHTEFLNNEPDSVLAHIIQSRKDQFLADVRRTLHSLVIELPPAVAGKGALADLVARAQACFQSCGLTSRLLFSAQAQVFFDDYIHGDFSLPTAGIASTKLVSTTLHVPVVITPAALFGRFDAPVADAFVASVSMETTSQEQVLKARSFRQKLADRLCPDSIKRETWEPHCLVTAEMIVFAQQDRMADVISKAASRWGGYTMSHLIPVKPDALAPVSLLPLSTALRLAPVEGEYLHGNSTTQGLLVETRGGQSQIVDIFAEANANFVAVATPGSGLSAFSYRIFDDVLARKGCLRIIESGMAFDQYRDIQGGKSVQFDASRPVSLNPFWGIDSETELTRRIGLFTTIFDAALNSELFAQFFDFTIDTAVRAAWAQHGSTMGFKDVFAQIEILAKHGRAAAYMLVEIIQHHPTFHPESTWLNGQPIDLSADDFVVFELERLQPDYLVYRVVSVLCALFVDVEFSAKKPEQKKLLMVPEAWGCLVHPEFAAAASLFGASASRYNGALGLSSMRFQDYTVSEWARQILANVRWKFLLRHKEESLRQFVINSGLLNVTLAELKAFRSIQAYPGRFEFAIVADGKSTIYCCKGSEYEYRSTLMHHHQRDAYYALRKEGKPPVEAIDQSFAKFSSKA